MSRKAKKPSRKVSSEKIKEYIDYASSIFDQDKVLANKYVQKARRIGMKYKLRMPRGYKRKFCKHCYSLLVPGKNLRVRTREGHVVYLCMECKKYMRFPYKKSKKTKD